MDAHEVDSLYSNADGFSRNRVSISFVQATIQDIRYALRTLWKQPIFTLVAALPLTLEIGANTAIFSRLYQILLRPLRYPEAERLDSGLPRPAQVRALGVTPSFFPTRRRQPRLGRGFVDVHRRLAPRARIQVRRMRD